MKYVGIFLGLLACCAYAEAKYSHIVVSALSNDEVRVVVKYKMCSDMDELLSPGEKLEIGKRTCPLASILVTNMRTKKTAVFNGPFMGNGIWEIKDDNDLKIVRVNKVMTKKAAYTQQKSVTPATPRHGRVHTGHVVQDVGTGVGEVVADVGYGAGRVVEGAGEAVGDVAEGIGEGIGHIFGH